MAIAVGKRDVGWRGRERKIGERRSGEANVSRNKVADCADLVGRCRESVAKGAGLGARLASGLRGEGLLQDGGDTVGV